MDSTKEFALWQTVGKSSLRLFCIRFTEQERKSLEQAAGDRALWAYIRWLIFKDQLPAIRTRNKKPVKDHKQLSELIAVLSQSRIASNINQLAKAANSGSLPVEVFEQALEAIEKKLNMEDQPRVLAFHEREQRQARKALETDQQKRWQKEEIERNSRTRKGFKDIWDKVNPAFGL